MKCKQLKKRAKALGWYLIRNGGRHEVWGHDDHDHNVTIPYNAKDYVGKLILRQLAIQHSHPFVNQTVPPVDGGVVYNSDGSPKL